LRHRSLDTTAPPPWLSAMKPPPLRHCRLLRQRKTSWPQSCTAPMERSSRIIFRTPMHIPRLCPVARKRTVIGLKAAIWKFFGIAAFKPITVLLRATGYRFESGYLEVFRDVTLNGERVGTLFLQSDQRQWSERARRYSAIVGIFVLFSGLFALLVSSQLQRLISRPILHLENAMRMVSTNKNYEVRATRFYSDEIGRLINGFNTMLS